MVATKLPPIPDTAALFIPPVIDDVKRTATATHMLHFFWRSSPDSLNFVVELTEQKRLDDPWLNAVVTQCRY